MIEQVTCWKCGRLGRVSCSTTIVEGEVKECYAPAAEWGAMDSYPPGDDGLRFVCPSCLTEPFEPTSRWVTLRRTSNSGKTLFLCLVCGRESTTPDKECPQPMWGSDSKLYRCHLVEAGYEVPPVGVLRWAAIDAVEDK